jgi:hypothetical protein
MTITTNATNPKRPPKAVYTIIERRESGRKHWVRIGAAFENRDGSYHVRLDALPTNGVMHIRELSDHARADKSQPVADAEVAS